MIYSGSRDQLMFKISYDNVKLYFLEHSGERLIKKVVMMRILAHEVYKLEGLHSA